MSLRAGLFSVSPCVLNLRTQKAVLLVTILCPRGHYDGLINWLHNCYSDET